MKHQIHVLARSPLLMFLVAGLFALCTSDEQGNVNQGLANTQPTTTPKMFSKDELGDRIKDLLLKRPERPDKPDDFEVEFEDLFEQLNTLALGMPDDFEFDVRTYGPPEGHPTQLNKKAMECLSSANQFKHFMHKVHEVMMELSEEYLDDLKDSAEVDDNTDSREKFDNEDDDKDSHDMDTTTDSPDSRNDNSTDTDNNNTSKDTDTTGTGIVGRRKRDSEHKGFDLDEVFDRLEDDDVECLSGFISKGDKSFLCGRYAHRSSGTFAKILAAGSECDDYLLDDDDDDEEDDDDLDESHQMAILRLFKNKETSELQDDDVKKILRLAPDVIDDDFLEKLSETLFEQNLPKLGRLATGQHAKPELRYFLREKLDDIDLDKLSAEDIRKYGPGLLSLSLDKIQTINSKALLDLDSDDLYDDDRSPPGQQPVQKVIHDDDDDDEDDIKLAVGLRVKEAVRQNGLQKNQIGRTMRYLHHDLDFVQSVEPDDLLDALDDIRDIDYDFDDAQSVIHRMVQSSRFPSAATLSARNLTRFGHLIRGMDTEYLSMLKKESLEDALDDISDIDFDDDQAYQLLENLGYTSDPQKSESTSVPELKRLRKLFRGMPTESIAKMKQDAIEEALDDLDDLDLNDAMKAIIVEKVRQNEKISAKFLRLKSFSDAISVQDLDDFDDDVLKMHLNTSSHIRWSLPQAAVLAQSYIMAKGARRLRASDFAQMKTVALGILPDDLNDVATQDDLLDIAEELKDINDDLTSGQIDKLTERFTKLSALGQKAVTIDEAEAFQASHVLAYLSPELFGKLEFTKPGKKAFVSQVAKLSTHKMSREHVQFLAEKMMDMIDDMDSSEAKIKKPEDRESLRLRSLGQMALGLTPSKFSEFSGKAIIDNLDILRNLALTKVQAKAVLERVEDAVENWRCQSGLLARVGPLLQHHDDPFDDDCDVKKHDDRLGSFEAVAKGLEKRREMVQKRLDAGFAKENDDATDDAGEKKLVDAVVSLATQKVNVRRRRATTSSTNGPLSCDVLIRLGNAARLLSVNQLKTLSNEELKRCLPQLGAISDWSTEVLKALADRVKQIYADVSSWSAKIVAAAGSLIAGLSATEIKMLNGLNGVDVLHKVGKHGKLSTEQLRAGFRRWMELSKKNDVSDITAGEFSAMSEFVCGLEAAEINRLKDITFRRGLHTLGQSSSCSQEQLQAYFKKALMVYNSSVDQWEPAIIADMGSLLAALSVDNIKMLNPKQLALISPKTIQTLPDNRIAAMSTKQLMTFSSNQANAVTKAQYEALTDEQKKIVSDKSTIDFTKPNGGSNRNRSGTINGIHYGLLTIIAVIVAVMWS